MLRRTFLAAACVAAVSSMAAGTAQAQTVFNMSTYAPYQHPLVSQAMVEWAGAVEKESGGRLKINVLTTALGQPQAQYDLAVNGIADIVLAVPGYSPGRFPLSAVGELPQTADTAEALSVALWRLFEKTPEMQKEFREVKVLGLFATSPYHFQSAKGSIKAIGDFKGVKVRVGGGVGSKVIEALGSTTVLQPAGKTFELLSGGVVDATVFPLETLKSFKLESLVKNVSVVPGGLGAASLLVAINRAKFDALSPEDKNALLKASGENLARINGRVWDNNDKLGIKAFVAAGGTVTNVDDAVAKQMAQAMHPALEAWSNQVKKATGVDGLALLSSLRAEAAAVK